MVKTPTGYFAGSGPTVGCVYAAKGGSNAATVKAFYIRFYTGEDAHTFTAITSFFLRKHFNVTDLEREVVLSRPRVAPLGWFCSSASKSRGLGLAWWCSETITCLVVGTTTKRYDLGFDFDPGLS